MAISLTINSKTFSIPTPGEDPGWGGDTTDWIKEANAVISSLFGPGDILQSSFNIANGVASAEPILGLSFNPATVRAAEIQYSIYRRSDVTTDSATETGTMRLYYDNDAGNRSIATTVGLVDEGTDIITLPNHSFNSGELVTYNSDTTAIGGLVSGNQYYIIKVDNTSFQLESTLGGGAIDLTDDGAGTHSFVSTSAKWKLSQDYDGDAGVTFEIDEASGQLTYVSTDIDPTNYSGVIKFRAKALSQ